MNNKQIKNAQMRFVEVMKSHQLSSTLKLFFIESLQQNNNRTKIVLQSHETGF